MTDDDFTRTALTAEALAFTVPGIDRSQPYLSYSKVVRIGDHCSDVRRANIEALAIWCNPVGQSKHQSMPIAIRMIERY